MRSWPIWNVVEACNYKLRKDYGIRDTGEVTVCIGTSGGNSHEFIRHVTSRRQTVSGEYTVFRFGVDMLDGKGLQVLKTKYVRNKDRTMMPDGWTPDE